MASHTHTHVTHTLPGERPVLTGCRRDPGRWWCKSFCVVIWPGWCQQGNHSLNLSFLHPLTCKRRDVTSFTLAVHYQCPALEHQHSSSF